MSERSILQRASDLALILGVVFIVGLLIRREFFASGTPNSGPRRVPAWERIAATGPWLHRGGAEALQIVVFSDFQCPFCAKLVPVLDSLVTASPTAVSIRFRQFPLEAIHPHARMAARASLCADQMGRFRELHDAFFLEPAQLGTRPWTVWALQAGITDTAAFKTCLDAPATDSLVAADLAVGAELSLSGTPAILVEDELFSGLVPTAVLQARIGR